MEFTKEKHVLPYACIILGEIAMEEKEVNDLQPFTTPPAYKLRPFNLQAPTQSTLQSSPSYSPQWQTASDYFDLVKKYSSYDWQRLVSMRLYSNHQKLEVLKKKT